MKEITLTLNNKEQIIKQIKKYLKKDQDYLLKLEKKTNDISNSKEIEELIKAFNIKDLRKRYTYIYDTMCTYLDEKFKEDNICDFKNNKCIAVRENAYFENDCGCCYGPKRGKCQYLKNNTCSIKSISCKLFTCRYLRKKDIKFPIKDQLLLKLFFNNRQKYLISYSIFIDKEIMIENLLKLKWKFLHFSTFVIRKIIKRKKYKTTICFFHFQGKIIW